MGGHGGKPIPFDSLPQPGDAVVQLFSLGAIGFEVLARGEQAFHQEGRFHEVRAVVVHIEDWQDVPGAAAEEMGPHAVKAVGLLKKCRDLQEAIDGLGPRDKATFSSNDNRHDPKAAGPEGNDVVVARRTLACHPGMRLRRFPVVAE